MFFDAMLEGFTFIGIMCGIVGVNWLLGKAFAVIVEANDEIRRECKHHM